MVASCNLCLLLASPLLGGAFLFEDMSMDYMTVSEAAKMWGIGNRRIVTLCNEGRIDGAVKFGRSWAIPKGVEHPSDNRIKSGKYVKAKEE